MYLIFKEERQRTKEREQGEVESSGAMQADMPVERILEAEKRVECKVENQNEYENAVANICQATNTQLYQLVEWAKHIPHFSSLPIEDQVLLLRAGNRDRFFKKEKERDAEEKFNDFCSFQVGTNY